MVLNLIFIIMLIKECIDLILYRTFLYENAIFDCYMHCLYSKISLYQLMNDVKYYRPILDLLLTLFFNVYISSFYYKIQILIYKFNKYIKSKK